MFVFVVDMSVQCNTLHGTEYKKAQLMLAYLRDAKTMKKIPPFRSYNNKFQSSRKSGVYSNYISYSNYKYVQ